MSCCCKVSVIIFGLDFLMSSCLINVYGSWLDPCTRWTICLTKIEFKKNWETDRAGGQRAFLSLPACLPSRVLSQLMNGQKPLSWQLAFHINQQQLRGIWDNAHPWIVILNLFHQNVFCCLLWFWTCGGFRAKLARHPGDNSMIYGGSDVSIDF